MNQRSDIERVLRHWFDDGAATMPDRVVDVVTDRISRQRQRRAWRLPWRPFMNTYVKLAAGLAAAVVLALAAWQLLPGRGGIGGQPTPTPSTGPVSSPVPTLDVRPCSTPTPCAGALAAGAHAAQNFQPAFTFTVPAGWVNGADADWGYILYPNTSANEVEFARSGDVAQSIGVGAVDGWADDWSICPGVITDGVATSATGIAATLKASPNLITTTPQPIELGGLSGQTIDVRLNPAWSGTCPLDPDDPRDKDFTEIRHRIWLLDLPAGGLVPIMISSLSGAGFEPFLEDAVPIVQSFQFDLGPAAS